MSTSYDNSQLWRVLMKSFFSSLLFPLVCCFVTFDHISLIGMCVCVCTWARNIFFFSPFQKLLDRKREVDVRMAGQNIIEMKKDRIGAN